MFLDFAREWRSGGREIASGEVGPEEVGPEEFDTNNTGGKERGKMMKNDGKGWRFQVVGGLVEVWTHRRSSGNGGDCKGIGGSCDIANHSNTFIESLIDMRKLLSFVRFDREGVSLGETGFDDLQQSFDHGRVEHAHLPGSTSYNHQSINTSTSTNNDDNEGRVRFVRSGMFVERLITSGAVGIKSWA